LLGCQLKSDDETPALVVLVNRRGSIPGILAVSDLQGRLICFIIFADASRPYIHYCRSPDMETFTCWWHPLDNGPQGDDNLTYSLMYTIGKKSPKECPDYVSGGANSCYFDEEHTVIWELFCMNVTARSLKGSFTSEQCCLDVADIVETDPPFNLTYTLLNISNHESGRTAHVSWQYPIASHVRSGWITLIFELRFRHVPEPNKWKVKERLREPYLELLDLPVGNYEVQVRCRSQNSNLWSKWSSTLMLIVPPRKLSEQVYVMILVIAIGVTTMFIIGIGVISQGKRIKAYLIPPIPKPCIRGIDPMLLKKGKMDEINSHFSSLYGYKSSQYHEETLCHESMDEEVTPPQPSLTSSHDNDATPPESQQLLLTVSSPSDYCQAPVVYGEEHPYNKDLEVALPAESNSPVWSVPSHTQPELVSFPGMDYSMILDSASLSTTAPPTFHDFYTCVNRVSPSGAVHLVPCVSNVITDTPCFQVRQKLGEDSEKNSQLVVHLEKQAEVPASFNPVSPGEAEQSEFAVSIHPHQTHGS
ncbi:hypothetical protein P4O66_021461, partial [Electrophorus voltai]